ncbi:unnamed protein product [Darwinula stevensoni]|uniref:Beta/gamma crystallin 'Greek key' domain-containing protein n=1 Tax=Darwinula stevensoni TaxID=69355 RepID=A0A7R9AA64_9CRUS|nr:unnamed protein product [Darwinula stevensoni]CAG0898117.1 unnamed protein product [Darwinula stevensoni]
MDFRNCGRYVTDNVVSSACVTGVWIFYSEYSYNYQNVGAVEWIYGDDYRSNLKTVGNQVSSLRYAGDSKDWKASTITLYEFDLFAGKEYYESGDSTEVPSEMTTVRSFIVTGQGFWTLYASKNFNGNGICVGAQPGNYAGFAPDLNAFGIGTVRSFRKACFTKSTTVQLDSDQHGVVLKAAE